jgi:hypothetical protein
MLSYQGYTPDTALISRKSPGGCPTKLSKHDIHYATRLVGTRKTENVVQVTKTSSINLSQHRQFKII